jgi:adenine-specific DNA methylase
VAVPRLLSVPASSSPLDLPELRKARGAFFTPQDIADFLAEWAVDGDPAARVLDPSCGDGVFLRAAARELVKAGAPQSVLSECIYGVDVHQPSLADAKELLSGEGLDARLITDDFFNLPTPAQSGCPVPEMDAVIGNPPFIRYQEHTGEARRRSAQAALAQGVRLSGLASSWAALLVHSCAFLKPEGRLAMVMPAELLTVHYAEPVRRWLRRRFAAVYLVMFEHLQFEDALERVILVVAKGSGGCDAFSLFEVDDAADLPRLHAFDHLNVTPAAEGKWTDILLPQHQRQLFKRVSLDGFTPLDAYGAPELGTVTGANKFFALSEATRLEYGLDERHLRRISPPGTKHLRGLSFTSSDWKALREADERVWLLCPAAGADKSDKNLRAYLIEGELADVPDAYKCSIRTLWYRPPVVSAPDLFFTYMSHRYPRLIANTAGATFVNSMHGVRFRPGTSRQARSALPLLALNSVTMLGAEIYGRSYGGGILKMEPREAAILPMPKPEILERAWNVLKGERAHLDRQLRSGLWMPVARRVDEVLLSETLGLSSDDIGELHSATQSLRARRLGRKPTAAR